MIEKREQHVVHGSTLKIARENLFRVPIDRRYRCRQNISLNKKRKKITHLEEEQLWLVVQAGTRIGQERRPEHLGCIKHVIGFQEIRCSGSQHCYCQTVVIRMILGRNFNKRID